MWALSLWLVLGAAVGGCAAPPIDAPPADAPANPSIAGPSGPPIARQAPAPGPNAPRAPEPRTLGPEVQVEPSAGPLRGLVRFTVRAHDAAGVTGLRFTAPEALVHVEPRFRWTGAVPEATLDAVLDTGDLPDGALRVGVRAESAGGRVTERVGRFTVSNVGPAIRWSAPADGEVVRGRLTIRAHADDPDGVSALALERVPTTADGGVHEAPGGDEDPSPGGLALTADTTAWPEGPVTLSLIARDANGNATRAVRTVFVDNRPTVYLEGRASLGGPVVRGRVRLFACTPSGRDGPRVDQCPPEGCPTDEAGRFLVPLVDDHDGPTRVRVSASPQGVTLVRDPLAESLQPMPASAALTALIAHPALAPIQVHGVTTLVDATTTAWLAEGVALADALPVADALWGEHVCDRCAPGRTDPAEVAGPPEGPPPARLTPPIRLAVVHAGLYQLAAEHTEAARRRGRTRPTSAWDLLSLLRRDLGDGLLDGRSAGASFDPRIDPHTVRMRLAGSIAALLEARPGWLRIEREALRGEAGWLDAIAGRRSALWPDLPAPLPLDQTPPTLRITAPLPDASAGPDRLRLTAEATDDGLPPSMHVVAPPGVLVWRDPSEPGHLVAHLDLRRRGPGPAEIRVLAEDAAGLLTEASVTIHVDHQPPPIMLTDLDGLPIEPETQLFSQAPSFGFFAASDDPEVQFEVNRPAELRPLGDRTFVAVRELTPGQNRVHITAIDRAGNRTTVSFGLHLQLSGPTIEVEDSDYMPASEHAPSAYGCQPVEGEPEAPPICAVRLDRVGARRRISGALLARDDPPPTLQVFPLRSTSYMAPTAYLTITDETGHGVVEIRARQPDGRWLPWRTLQPTVGDRYALDLSLPQGALGSNRTRSSDETVEIRAIDAVGHVTVRTLRWRREVVAPPISIQVDSGYAERETPITPGGYGFGPDDPSIVGLAEPGAPAVAGGIGLARWRVYNPWPIPISVRLDGRVTVAHSRSNAYAVDGLFPGAEPPCAPGEFYRATPDGQHPTSGCAGALGALAASGERLITRLAQDWRPATMNPAGELIGLPDDQLRLEPQGHAMLILTVAPAPVRMWPELSRPVPELDRLHHVSAGLGAVLRTARVDREAALRWSLTDLHVTTALPAAEPGTSDVMWSALDDVHIERVNPPLQMPRGFEVR